MIGNFGDFALYPRLTGCFLFGYSYLLSPVKLVVTPWTVAHQTPLSMGFSRQEYWSGLPFHSPGNLPNPWIKHMSLA